MAIALTTSNPCGFPPPPDPGIRPWSNRVGFEPSPRVASSAKSYLSLSTASSSLPFTDAFKPPPKWSPPSPRCPTKRTPATSLAMASPSIPLKSRSKSSFFSFAECQHQSLIEIIDLRINWFLKSEVNPDLSPNFFRKYILII